MEPNLSEGEGTAFSNIQVFLLLTPTYLRVDYTLRFRSAFLCPTNRLTQKHTTLVGMPLRLTVCRT
jgi:hypothetical protein